MLRDRVVEAREKIVLGRGEPGARLGSFFEYFRKTRPLRMPGLVVAQLRLELFLDEGEIAELPAGSECKKGVVGPAIVAGEKLEHRYSPDSSVTGGMTGLPSLIFIRLRACSASSGASRLSGFPAEVVVFIFGAVAAF